MQIKLSYDKIKKEQYVGGIYAKELIYYKHVAVWRRRDDYGRRTILMLSFFIVMFIVVKKRWERQSCSILSGTFKLWS